MTTATDESVELIDVSDDDDCSSVSSDIIFIEEVEFHNDPENNERSSKGKRRTKTIDVYFTSASVESSKLVTPLSFDTAPILPPEGIAVPIKVYISLLCISFY